MPSDSENYRATWAVFELRMLEARKAGDEKREEDYAAVLDDLWRRMPLEDRHWANQWKDRVPPGLSPWGENPERSPEPHRGPTVNADSRALLFVCAPYASFGGIDIPENVRRAAALGSYAASLGFSPVVPHTHGFLGVYGSPSEKDETTRATALSCGVALARAIGSNRGRIWVIAREDGSLSEGCREEVYAFSESSGMTVDDISIRRWSSWCALMGKDFSERPLSGGRPS